MKTLVILALFSSALPAQQGKKLFEAKCAVCHSADSNEARVGPGLKGAKDGTLSKWKKQQPPELILKQLNSGGDGMPVFKELLTDDEKKQLIAYVLSL